jgi:hypothetical protein
MALNNLYISTLNPVKFSKANFANPTGYRTPFFDDFRYQDTLRSFHSPANFFQPWQKSDTIKLHIWANFAGHTLSLFTCQGVQVATFPIKHVVTSIETIGLSAYEVSVPLAGYDPGNYYFTITSGSNVFWSEVFTLAEVHDLSVLLEYYHDENNFDVAFESGIQFSMRVPGGLTDYLPASDRTVFIDQPRNIVQLSGKSFATQKLIIGTAEGVPDYLAERVNDIFLCSTVNIDGRQYVANDGAKMEPSREELYPLTGWALEVRPARARSSKLLELDEPDGTSSVLYNIQTHGFGGITTEAGDNVVQIINNDI